MLARMYSKKKRPLPISGYDDGGSAQIPQAMTSPVGGHRMTSPMGNRMAPHGAVTLTSRSHSSRMSRQTRDDRKIGDNTNKNDVKTAKNVKKYFMPNSKEYAKRGDGMPMTPQTAFQDGGDEYDYGYDQDVGSSDDEPQLLRPRRRFVRSGLTTYEQWISKNAMGRRFKQPNTPQEGTPMGTPMPATPVPQPHVSTPKLANAEQENMKSNRAQRGDSGDRNGGAAGNMSSLSTALQEVIRTRPTALKSAVDPSAGPQKVAKSFVVEQTEDGNLFVTSRRVPHGPVRQVKDDSFIMADQVHTAEAGATGSLEFEEHVAAASLMRRSEMDASYSNKWVAPTKHSAQASVAAVMASGKAGLRRRLSGADRQSSAERSNLGTATDVLVRRAPASVKVREPARAGQSILNHMAHKYIDHMRQRSGSRTGDGPPPPLPPPRKESTNKMQAQSIEVVDASPTENTGILNDHLPTTDKGPMTMDEFFDSSPAPPPPPPRTKPSRAVFSGGKSTSRSRRTSSAALKRELEEEAEVDNALMNSFRNLKDVDALKRSRSLEDDPKPDAEVPPPVVETPTIESEEEYPDFVDDRATMDYGSSCEDESAVRNSNIADFLGGFKSRNSINRNSLAGRNSLGLNSQKNDFVSRAARSLRNSRKAAQEAVKVESELSRKLREARGRVPTDLRGDPPQKRRGFLSRDHKRVRFDMTPYIREFEVIEPEESDDDQEVQRWQQRESEMDDDEDDDELSNPSDYEDDIGVPIPGPVIAAAVAEGTPYFSAPSYSYNPGKPQPAQHGRPSTTERVSVVSRRSTGKRFEVLL